ncbi:MAG: hypothetical protein IPP29_17150 [Bacteroidetes bacterium]|nr:hypothetical protein [Bacteroidota bacterium]
MTIYANAQSYNNLWLMGYGSGSNYGFGGTDMKFTSSAMDTSYHFREMNFHETNGVITDKNGKLLFYINGEYVANALDDTMKNGQGLKPGWYVDAVTPWGLRITQGNLVIPFAMDSNKFYLFHNSAIYNTNFGGAVGTDLMVSIIDMQKDSGRGKVVSKNQILVNDTLGGTIAGVKHGNGRDWWVVFFKCNSNLIYTLLITPQGIQGPYTQSFGDSIYAANGQCVFSPDGSRFARHNRFYPHQDISIYDFDRCTG